jgi:hypothetical protein
MPSELMISPKALNQLVQIGAVNGNTLPRRCCHREFRGDIWQCPQPALVICGACGKGTCLDAYHAYSRFCTVSDPKLWCEKVGSKFYYRCEHCLDFLCVVCLGIADDYPCEPSQLENYPFRCPKCQGIVRVVRQDGVDHAGVVAALSECPSRMLQLNAGTSSS